MMEHKRKFFSALLACALCAGRAWGAEGDYVLKGGKGYRVDKAKDRLIEMGENIRRPEDEGTFPCIQRADTDAGLISCVLVDPEFEGMEGSEGGIYFFLGEKPAGFLPMKEAPICELHFSPSGEKLAIHHTDGEERWFAVDFYLVDAANKSFVKKASFFSERVIGFWTDPHRFAFTTIDKKKGFRPGSQNELWSSAALYDTVEEELIVLKEATATQNYVVVDCDLDAGTLKVIETSVKDEKDWDESSEGIHELEALTIPIPAAG